VLWALLLLPWVIALVLWLLWRRHHHLDVGTVVAAISGLAAVSLGSATLWVTWAAYRGPRRSGIPVSGLSMAQASGDGPMPTYILRPFIGPARPNFGPARPNFGPAQPNFGPARPNFGPAQAPSSKPSATIDMEVHITLYGTIAAGAQRWVRESIRNQVVAFTAKLREVERRKRAPGAEPAEYTAEDVIKTSEFGGSLEAKLREILLEAVEPDGRTE
jgi:hypothetical protein